MIPGSPGEIAFTLGPVTVHWYGLALAIAAIVAVYIMLRLAEQIGFKRELIVDAILWTVITGFIGARLYHVWNEWWYYKDHVEDMWKIWEGGLAIHGGIVFGLLTLFIFTRQKRLSFLRVLDVTAIGLIAAQAIGRLGNYFNQELFGRPTEVPWSLFIAETHRPDQFISFETFHPLFLYELLLNAALFGFLVYVWKRRKETPGLFLSLYLIGYAAIRFSLDFLRFDQFGFGPLTLAQWVSIVMFAIGCWFLFRKIRLTSTPPQT